MSLFQVIPEGRNISGYYGNSYFYITLVLKITPKNDECDKIQRDMVTDTAVPTLLILRSHRIRQSRRGKVSSNGWGD